MDGSNGATGLFNLSWVANYAPSFYLQPQPQNILAGSNATFNAAALSLPTGPSYQWTRDGITISGATSSSLIITNVTTNNTGDYAVIATNYVGSSTSAVAHLQVYPTATPLLSGYSFSNEDMTFTVSGITNSTYLVQASTNLTNWQDVHTGQVTYIYIDTYGITNSNYPQRFYRALWAP